MHAPARCVRTPGAGRRYTASEGLRLAEREGEISCVLVLEEEEEEEEGGGWMGGPCVRGYTVVHGEKERGDVFSALLLLEGMPETYRYQTPMMSS